MKRVPKHQSEKIHFKKQLAARWNIGRVNHEEYWALCAKAALAPVVLKQSERVSVRLVDIRGENIMCIYDAKRGTLVTCLPRGVMDPEQVHEYVWRRRG